VVKNLHGTASGRTVTKNHESLRGAVVHMNETRKMSGSEYDRDTGFLTPEPAGA